MGIEFQYEPFTKIKASGVVNSKFGINRFELWLLVAFSIYLGVKGKLVCSTEELLSEITGNTRLHGKFKGYLKGLITKGFVIEMSYNNRVNGHSIAITNLGKCSLIEYYRALKTISDKIGPIKPGYTIDRLAVDPFTLSDTLPKYKWNNPIPA